MSGVRHWLVVAMAVTAATILLWRAVQLQIIENYFLQDQGAARHVRDVTINAHRGMLLDRRGEVLAVSTPVDSVWVNPSEFSPNAAELQQLAGLLGLNSAALDRTLDARSQRKFLYLKRGVSPELGAQVKGMGLDGLYLEREYRRYYPAGESAGQVLGFTDVDDVGREGLELLFEQRLAGSPGAKRMIRDLQGRWVENVESIRVPHPGETLTLSLDKQLQYLAYRELKRAVTEHQASAATAVLLDGRSGEVLAMVNLPVLNPNNSSERRGSALRNRAVTDLFEPGSTMKPFTVAAALDQGLYRVDDIIETSPGWTRIGRYTIRDVHDYGRLTVAGVVQKSSNVGTTQIGLALKREVLWSYLDNLGFGMNTQSGFPGEGEGLLQPAGAWGPVEQATISYGYGLSATALQLARAYSVFATGGSLPEISFEPRPQWQAERAWHPVFPAKVTREVAAMLELVVGQEGTAKRAQVPGYRVLGKTGTVHKSEEGGYSADRYLSLFVGLAPASAPRLVLAVVVDEPKKDGHYGGAVAAPVFSRVMGGALRLMNIPPDRPETFRALNSLQGDSA
ncbi:MAG: penicillin-binding protein 2 [Gammaproteobacteria bacterium]|nr:penicillin-binding protein 2 [Gammaproteobacteria bacterium]